MAIDFVAVLHLPPVQAPFLFTGGELIVHKMHPAFHGHPFFKNIAYRTNQSLVRRIRINFNPAGRNR